MKRSRVVNQPSARRSTSPVSAAAPVAGEQRAALQLERADLVDADRIAVLVDEPDLDARERLAAHARARARIVAAARRARTGRSRSARSRRRPRCRAPMRIRGISRSGMPSAPATAWRSDASGLSMPLGLGVVRELRVDRRGREQHGRLVALERVEQRLGLRLRREQQRLGLRRERQEQARRRGRTPSTAARPTGSRSWSVSWSSSRANDSCAAVIVRWLCGTARSSPGPEPAE